ncbi:hypothetical protein RLEG3_32105 [Rhizobium leguminosarum bv. trifolii WSM1689]|nr:hypothetical protein RLEG3_32105 [Rhizobium leguminosarum bv. trifolii WSM1689]
MGTIQNKDRITVLIRLWTQEQPSRLGAQRTDSPLLSLEMPISGV